MEERKEPDATTSPPSSLAGALSTLLSNPDLMEKILPAVHHQPVIVTLE